MTDIREKTTSKMDQVLLKLQEGVQAVFTGEKYMEYLRFMGKFHNYSINNQILIFTQCPGATLVAGYKAWNEKFHRAVKKGEKAISIIAPCKYKKEVDDTYKDGTVKVDATGKALKKIIECKGYTTCSVYDISQTYGEPVPEYISDLADPVTNYKSYLLAMEQSSPVLVRFDDLTGGVHGYYSPIGQEIVIQKGMSQMQTLKTLCHEISHARLNHGEKDDKTDKRTCEVQAESTAYVVCNALGLDTSGYSFAYIAGWSSDKDVKELKASLDVIKQTSTDMIDDITHWLISAEQRRAG